LTYSRHTQKNKQQQIMRTKTLLLTAAVLAAGLGASVAQSVFSVNAVGYVNISVPVAGYLMIVNPLNGTNNQLNTILKPPADTQLFRFVNGGYLDPYTYDSGAGWLDGMGSPTTATLNPGEGVFLYVPVVTNLTFVGDVPQGNLTNTLPVGYSIRGSQVPQSATLPALGFPDAADDQVFFWNKVSQGFGDPYTSLGGGSWLDGMGSPNAPTPAVGEAFFIYKTVTNNWTRSFSVN
jgi:hypothetical protein